MAKKTIKYLYAIWATHAGIASPGKIVFGFYGGEPLLNMELIKQIISYLESLHPIPNTIFKYNMTSNAVLLNKCQDYLAEKEFDILISLDGDEQGHSYRVDHAGNSSFASVFKNIQIFHALIPSLDILLTKVRCNCKLQILFFSAKMIQTCAFLLDKVIIHLYKEYYHFIYCLYITAEYLQI